MKLSFDLIGPGLGSANFLQRSFSIARRMTYTPSQSFSVIKLIPEIILSFMN